MALFCTSNFHKNPCISSVPPPGSLVVALRIVMASILKVAVVDTQVVLAGMDWAISSRYGCRHKLYHDSYNLIFA